MTHEGLDSLDKETLIRLVLAQAETIAALTKQCEMLLACVGELEAKLSLPPRTPDNSSTPPSKGQKPSATAKAKSDGKRKSHAGAHRRLHSNPTSSRDIAAHACQDCGADVSQRPQLACEAYDHIESPPIKPDVTRVTLYGGVCPC
jgi:transposase